MTTTHHYGIPSPEVVSSRKDRLTLESYRPTSSTNYNGELPMFSTRNMNPFVGIFGMYEGLDSPTKTRILHSLPDERKGRPITGNSPRILNNIAMGKLKMDPSMGAEQTNAYEFLQQKVYSPFFLAYNEKGRNFKESLTKNLEKCLNLQKIKTKVSSNKMLLEITNPKPQIPHFVSPRGNKQNNLGNLSLKVAKCSIVSKHQEPNIDMSPASLKLILSPRNVKSSNSTLEPGTSPHKRRAVNENLIIEKFLRRKPSKTSNNNFELPHINSKKITKQ